MAPTTDLRFRVARLYWNWVSYATKDMAPKPNPPNIRLVVNIANVPKQQRDAEHLLAQDVGLKMTACCHSCPEITAQTQQ